MKIQKVKYLKEELKKKNPDINHNYILTEKYDGWYGFVSFVNGEWGKICSSRGRVIPSLAHINVNEWLEPSPENVTIIFEITIPGESFYIMNGILNRKNEDAKNVLFMVHDVLTNSAYVASKREQLIPLMFKQKIRNPFVRTPILAIVNPFLQEHLPYLEEVLQDGGEGIVLKRANSFYERGKRNATLMKVKGSLTLDLVILRTFKTVGKKGEEATNLELRGKNGTKIVVVVSKHSDIEYIENNLDVLENKIVEVSCMKELENGMLREPIFKSFRHDKIVGDR